MKLETTNTAPIEVVGGSKSSSFSIAMNAKAFRVLSDTLYQNKIGSIVREISCNAYDAHIAAGCKDKPFEVHLPDAFEPWFSVKDYGIGLTPKEVRNVLTVYFESTKDQSNESIGAFGLGAKTPFSYTDQFTVTSVKDGKKTIYSAFISDSGVPDIKEMFSEKSTEPNGVEVKMSVKREDYNRFKEELKAQLQFFKVKPVCNQTVTYDSFKDVFVQTPSITIGSTTAYYNKIWIVQGNVGYVLDVSQLSGKISKENASFISSLSNRHVQINFNIGEIGVTASREGIEYNVNTIKNIEATLANARNEIKDTLQKEFDVLTKDWDRALFLNKNPIAQLIKDNFKVPSASYSNGWYRFDISKIVYPTNYNVLNSSSLLGTVRTIYAAFRSNSKRNISFGENIIPEANAGFVIFLKDKSSNCNKKMKHYFMTNKDVSIAYEVTMNDDIYDDVLIDRIKTILGGYDKIVRLSDIELPKAAPSDKVRNAVPNFYSCENTFSPDIRNWDKEYDKLDELEDDYVYVVCNNMQMSDADGKSVSQYQSLSQFEKDLTPLIAIREKTLSKIDGKTNFKELKDYIKEKHVEYDTEEIRNWLTKCIISNIASQVIPSEVAQKVALFKQHASDSEYTKFIAGILSARDRYNKDSNYNKNQAIAKFISWEYKNSERVFKKFDKKYKKFLDKYPLLKVQSDYQVRQVFPPEKMGLYLRAMEQYLKTEQQL